MEWNVVGSVLSSSGDDGRVLLWKQDLLVRCPTPLVTAVWHFAVRRRNATIALPALCCLLPAPCVTGNVAVHSNPERASAAVKRWRTRPHGARRPCSQSRQLVEIMVDVCRSSVNLLQWQAQ